MEIFDYEDIFSEPDSINFTYFMKLIRENFFTMLFLNLIFVLTCLPIITIGPATKALSAITMDIVRGKPLVLISDYIQHFRRNLLGSILIGSGIVIVFLVMLFSLFFYIQIGGENMIIRMVAVTTFVSLLVLLMFTLYLLKSNAYIDLEFRFQVKNAFLLSISTPRQLIICTLLVFIPTYFMITRFIIGLTAFILWQFSLNSLITSSIAYNVLKHNISNENLS